MAAIIYNQLEQAVRAHWHLWGDGYALYTTCSRCGEVKHCRGRVRAYVLCMDCYDQRGVS